MKILKIIIVSAILLIGFVYTAYSVNETEKAKIQFRGELMESDFN